MKLLLLIALGGCSAVTSLSSPRAPAPGPTSAPTTAGGALTPDVAAPTGCDAAHDHCLPADTWFAIPREWPSEQPGNAFPSKWVTGEHGGDDWLWAWRCDCQSGSRGVRTIAASADALQRGATVVFAYDDYTRGALPKDEREATRMDWSIGTVAEYDRAGARVRIAQQEGAPWIPAAIVRLVVEEQDRFRPTRD